MKRIIGNTNIDTCIFSDTYWPIDLMNEYTRTKCRKSFKLHNVVVNNIMLHILHDRTEKKKCTTEKFNIFKLWVGIFFYRGKKKLLKF